MTGSKLRALVLSLAVWMLVAALAPRGARAEDVVLKPGQEVALALDGALGVGSLISLAGNAARLAHGTPVDGVTRSWILSGYVLGTINTVLSPLLLIYGTDPNPTLGYSLGAAHGAIGVTNLALAIVNGVRYARLSARERLVTQRRPQLLAAPLLLRDSQGTAVLGAALSVARF